MGKDEIPNFKYKDVSNYYFKIGSDSYSVKILRNYNEDNLGRAIDIKECAIIYKEKIKKWQNGLFPAFSLPLRHKTTRIYG